jgi:hypothetical protein
MAQQAPKVGVKYIGRRPSFHDRLFGTGLDFERDQTHFVSFDLSRKFFSFPSEFERDDTTKQPKAAPVDADQDERDAQRKKLEAENDELHFLRDSIGRLERPELQVMAKTKYGQELDGRASVQKMREQVISLVDRFGAV